MRVHERVRIKSGKWAGAVGVVVNKRPETGMVKVRVSGVLGGEPVHDVQWYKAAALEVV